jgi:protein-disulfide isomerase
MQSIRSPEVQQRVLQDVTKGRAAGVEGTPTFFVNGQSIGLPANLAEFVQVVDDHLRTAQ